MKKIQQSHTLDMTKGKITPLLLKFAFPIFLGNLLQQIYNLADTAIAGNLLGDTAIAEIGATAALYSLIINSIYGLNQGFALSISRYFGASDKVKMKQSISWMILLSMSTAFIIAGILLGFQEILLIFLKVPGERIMGAKIYLTIILAGIPLTMLYNLEACLLQAIGNSMTPLLFLLFSSLLNIILDFLCMGPWKMGIRGAALATIIAQGVSAICCAGYIIRRCPELHITKKDFRASFSFVLHMFGTGISMALMNSIYNIGSVILQGSINALGTTYITAQVGGRKLAEFFHTPCLAIGTSVATYSSQNRGAGYGARIKKGIYVSVALLSVWWIIALLFTYTLSPYAVRLITGSSNIEIIQNAVQYLKLSIPVLMPMIILIIVRNALQGMQHTLLTLICSSLELIGKIIFAIWIVPVYGYLAVCICEPVTWVVCCIFIVLSAFYLKKEFSMT